MSCAAGTQEMADKFFLPTIILESSTYNRMRKDGVRRPFEQPAIVIYTVDTGAQIIANLPRNGGC